ncbi:uncharacterized protein C8Q71DRAFT_516941 [Rhodofomes roseus]|uniref:Secreted protein n=1 Tax=Rhodofomes roseus TaxID=34475 RepID=A0ABQ8KN95_9APHY|nr:uncharacterized protein C8Q71DRAFT_516941 [Rhodofomes roseus]KAH9839530.1 hypothetical protein C8Q71DRAFT_516941 [Rhodofomes roseus]
MGPNSIIARFVAWLLGMPVGVPPRCSLTSMTRHRRRPAALPVPIQPVWRLTIRRQSEPPRELPATSPFRRKCRRSRGGSLVPSYPRGLGQRASLSGCPALTVIRFMFFASFLQGDRRAVSVRCSATPPPSRPPSSCAASMTSGDPATTACERSRHRGLARRPCTRNCRQPSSAAVRHPHVRGVSTEASSAGAGRRRASSAPGRPPTRRRAVIAQIFLTGQMHSSLRCLLRWTVKRDTDLIQGPSAVSSSA